MIIGHKLGSALTMLSTHDVAEIGFVLLESIMGIAMFKEWCNESGLKFLIMVNMHNVMPKIP